MTHNLNSAAQESYFNFSETMEKALDTDALRHRIPNESAFSSKGERHNGISEGKTSSSPSAGAGGCDGRGLFGPKPLVHRKDLPKHLQFNPYIERGYRPLLTVWECILSLFYLHNETVNIITHGVPMLYILVWWENMIPWSEVSVPVLPWTHLISTLSPWVGSTIYHMFMNHRSGEGCYKSLLHLDMFGIWITQSFGALTTVYASVFCLSSTWIWRVLVVYCLVSLWCLYKALTAACAMSRRMCFSMAVVMQLGLLSWRATPLGGGHPGATGHYFMQDLLAVVGGFVGALRIPEKWVPGRLDFIANSHHIMHVVVVYAVYHLHQGAVLDMMWLSSNGTCAASRPHNNLF